MSEKPVCGKLVTQWMLHNILATQCLRYNEVKLVKVK